MKTRSVFTQPCFSKPMWNLATIYIPEYGSTDIQAWNEVYKWSSLVPEYGNKQNAPLGSGLTILALWLAGPGSVLANALYFYLMIPSFFDLLVKGILTDFFMSLPFPLIWTSYLLISKRVRNTYVKTVMKPPVL